MPALTRCHGLALSLLQRRRLSVSGDQEMTMKKSLLAALLLSTCMTQANAAEIQWWHAMGGELGSKLEEIVAGYNESQDEHTVVPTYKGTYPETMTAAIAAFRANEQPHIVQVFEVGTGTMMAAEGAIYPVYELMADAGEDFDPANFLSSVVGYYTDTDGNMLSMPFNSSTPILYYNKDVFEEAGLDAEQPPRTWAEMEQFSQQIIESGAATCGFTTSWLDLLDASRTCHAWHNQPDRRRWKTASAASAPSSTSMVEAPGSIIGTTWRAGRNPARSSMGRSGRRRRCSARSSMRRNAPCI
jgi:hypothetical protein